MNPNLRSEQFQLFDPGPERDPETYWHFSHEGADWDPRPGPMHLGTPKAAMDRASSVRSNTRPHELEGRSGKVHAARLRGPLMNTPEVPISDAMANVLSDRSADADDWQQASTELIETGAVDSEEGYILGSGALEQRAENELEEEGHRFRGHERGAYYTNRFEDQGSTSVVMNRPDRDLQHMGTVGYEPEFQSLVKAMDKDPITGEQVAVNDLYVSRGSPGARKTNLGPQFDWKQARIPVPRS